MSPFATHLSEKDIRQIQQLHFEGLRTIHRTARKHGIGLCPCNRSTEPPTFLAPYKFLRYAETLDNQEPDHGFVTGSLPCPFCSPYNLPLTASLSEIEEGLCLISAVLLAVQGSRERTREPPPTQELVHLSPPRGFATP
jgi:hypothetical protein